jgi:arabinan endo-1,5-alpha-L-arabinosidase
MNRRLVFLCCLLALPGRGAGQYVDIRVHDPVVIEAHGRFYLFATGQGIDVWSSSDLREWRREPPAFDSAAAWTNDVVPGFRNRPWAPDITYHNGQYHLFYSVSQFGRNTSAIGHATNVTLDRSDARFRWVDRGPVVRSYPGRDLWNAIDPHVAFDAEGTPWMSFGSFWSGIKLFRMTADLNAPAEPQTWHTIAARPRDWRLGDRVAGDSANSAIEAPFIFRKDGWYYLFVSWDFCCRGLASTYHVVVGRARAITGPYLDREGRDMRLGGGTVVVRGDSAWAGVGHAAAYTFGQVDYLFFHGYANFDQGRAKLWIRPIEWQDGWPRVSLK